MQALNTFLWDSGPEPEVYGPFLVLGDRRNFERIPQTQVLIPVLAPTRRQGFGGKSKNGVRQALLVWKGSQSPLMTA